MLVNRKAGSAGGSSPADIAESDLIERGFTVHRLDSFQGLEQQATKLSSAGRLRAAIAVGGDGTVGAVLNATPPGTPIAIVPAGTENLLAKYLEIDGKSGGLGDLLASGVAVSLDAGEVAASDDYPARLFALMISAGLDAEVVRQVHLNRTGNITHRAYAKPIFDAVRRYKYPEIRATWNDPAGQSRQATGRWLFGVNLPRYAQGLPIAPEASGCDGLLDLCVFRRGYFAAGLWYLWHIVRRSHHQLESVTTATCEEVLLESIEGKQVAYQIDGDPGGFLPVSVRVIPNRLTLLVPPNTASRLGFTLGKLNPASVSK